MSIVYTNLWLRLRALIRRKRVEDELDDELQFHVAMQTHKNLAAGMEAAAAARQARIQFGGVGQTKEDCRTVRGTGWIENAGRDIRYALRGFRRAPGFAIAVIATMALGLGLNTTLFTIFNAYVLRPFALRDPTSLYRVDWTNRAARGGRFSWPEFESLQRENPAWSEAGGQYYLFARVEGHPLQGELVTGNYFRMLGVNAIRGRTLVPADASGSEPALVLGYLAWQRKFGGDPEIVGRKILIHGYPLEVVGIVNPHFSGLGDTPRDFCAPVTLAGRLADGRISSARNIPPGSR